MKTARCIGCRRKLRILPTSRRASINDTEGLLHRRISGRAIPSPGLSEADRLDCVFNEERPSPRQWCNDKFDYGRKGAPASWRHCTNELYVLNGLPRTEPKQPKTAGEMRQDEREFMETASAYARRHYRACILQFAKPSNVARQSCRDLARGSEELSKKLHDFTEDLLRKENPLHGTPERLTSPDET